VTHWPARALARRASAAAAAAAAATDKGGRPYRRPDWR
jgi:hypothetical protein